MPQPSVRSVEGGQRLGIEGRAERLLHEGGDFVQGEAQLAHPDLAQFPACTQPHQRERWVLACAQDEVQGAWRMAEQFAQQGVDGFFVHQVIVVQHEDEALTGRQQLAARACGAR